MDLSNVSMFMDTSQDFEPPRDGVVRWVASQSSNPALQALMNEAERDKRSRPFTPAHSPRSWTYPLASTTSSASLSTSITSSWHSGGHGLADASDLPPLSGSSSASSSYMPPRNSEPSGSRRTKPLSAVQRKPLASSTSSANRPFRDSARPRSASHSTTLSDPSASKEAYVSQDEGPEAMAFIELLKDVSRQLDENSKKKQRLVVRAKEREQERSLGRSGIDNRLGFSLDAHHSSTRSLTKTSSASSIYPSGSTTRALERTSIKSLADFKAESRGRAMTKTASLGALGVDLVCGRSTPPSLPSPTLNRDLKLAPAPHLPACPSNNQNVSQPATRKTRVLEPTLDNGDDPMQGVIDLTETDSEWESPISGPMTRPHIATTYMQVDEDSDARMDTSFFQAEPPLRRAHIAPSKPRPVHPSPAPPMTQRTHIGPPPLGMRRTPQLQSSQYGASHASKGLSVPRFKPPLLAGASGAVNKVGSGAKPVKTSTTTSSSRPAPRGATTKVDVAEMVAPGSRDADSSFDVSFGMDADALEEAMKAYD